MGSEGVVYIRRIIYGTLARAAGGLAPARVGWARGRAARMFYGTARAQRKQDYGEQHHPPHHPQNNYEHDYGRPRNKIFLKLPQRPCPQMVGRKASNVKTVAIAFGLGALAAVGVWLVDAYLYDWRQRGHGWVWGDRRP